MCPCYRAISTRCSFQGGVKKRDNMHLHFEKNTDTKCDCSILSLSWMGKVPDDIPEVSGSFKNDYIASNILMFKMLGKFYYGQC